MPVRVTLTAKGKIMKHRRPILSPEQIKQLKADVKQFSNELAYQANLRKFPVTTIQNSVGRALGFTSFSELNMHSKSSYSGLYIVDFNFFDSLDVKDLLDIYGTTYQHYFNDVLDTINESREARKTASQHAVVSPDKLKSAFDEDLINGGILNLSTGLPSEFKVHQSANGFKDKIIGDIFTVIHQGKSTNFTIKEESRMLNTDKPVIYIEAGNWYEVDNGWLSLGQ